MNTSSVDMIKKSIDDYQNLKKILLETGELTYELFTTDIFRKYLLISCASLFENQIQELISKFVEAQTSSEMLKSLIKHKVIERQYHTYFDWKDKSANSFYKLFGAEFLEKVKFECSNNNLKKQERAFLEIGVERNLMVHENFLGYQLNKTVDEISELFLDALKYLEFLESVIIA